MFTCLNLFLKIIEFFFFLNSQLINSLKKKLQLIILNLRIDSSVFPHSLSCSSHQTCLIHRICFVSLSGFILILNPIDYWLWGILVDGSCILRMPTSSLSGRTVLYVIPLLLWLVLIHVECVNVHVSLLLLCYLMYAIVWYVLMRTIPIITLTSLVALSGFVVVLFRYVWTRIYC